MKYELYDLIVQSASTGLTLQNIDGSFPKGHDGPWNNEDTFLRTTSHWAILIAKAYELTNERKFLDAVFKACNFLISEEARPYKYTFFCRTNTSGKDLCNGLIGQAWVLEALILIGRQLSEQKYLDIAKNVIQVHPYDYNKHSWSAVEIDGTVLGEYTTLNQQVWFSAMVVTLGDFLHDDHLLFPGIDFFSNLHRKIRLAEGGIIEHSYLSYQSHIGKMTRTLIKRMNLSTQNEFQKVLSLSYLTFLLNGIALAVDVVSRKQLRSIIRMNEISKAIKYVELHFPYGYLEGKDSYRWSYNPVGIEMAYILQVMTHKFDLLTNNVNEGLQEVRITKWLSTQIKGYYDFNENLLNKNTNDPHILAARFYEAVRLNNYKFEVNS